MAKDKELSMKVYHVEGIRHSGVVFAETHEKAISQAVEQDLVGDWEAPQATEIDLPKGYKIVYDEKSI